MTANDNAWLEAQVGVLGSVLIEPSLAAKVVAETDEGDYTGDCRSIYRAITELLAAHEPVDAMTVRSRLGPDSEPAIRRMMELTPTAANVSAYIAAAKEQARLLALQRIGADLMASISLDDARELISKASALTVDRRGFAASTMAQMMDDFMTRHGENKQTEFLDWGLPAINDYIHITKGKYIILGGYPSDGKSALMAQWAVHMAKTQRVGIFSLETDAETLENRIVSHIAKTSLGKIIRNDLRLGEWQTITGAISRYYGIDLSMIDAAGMTAQDIAATAMAKRFDIVFVDYLQLIDPGTRYRGSRAEEVAGISRTLQRLAKKQRINVVALSQLSRPESGKSGSIPAPTMRSLRESGQLEQDADVIMLLYRQEPTARSSPRMLQLAKNKEGESGVAIKLQFDGGTQTFYRNAYDEVERVTARARRDSRISELQPAEDVPFDNGQTELPM